MPPFGAVKGFGELRDDQALTQEEIHLISDWVEGGSPEGDPTLLPKPPDFTQPAKPQPPQNRRRNDRGRQPDAEAPGDFRSRSRRELAEGSSIQAVAEQPDGIIQPLIWIYDYKPKFDQTYYFRKPLTFPAGTKIETFPAGGGSSRS